MDSFAFLGRARIRSKGLLRGQKPRSHEVTSHKFAMIGVYVGGILVAGLFTLAPGRYIHQLVFG